MNIIFIASDGSLMSRDDLLSWLIWNLKYCPERRNWNFDEFTGGQEFFLSREVYLNAKSNFEKLKFFLEKNKQHKVSEKNKKSMATID